MGEQLPLDLEQVTAAAREGQALETPPWQRPEVGRAVEPNSLRAMQLPLPFRAALQVPYQTRSGKSSAQGRHVAQKALRVRRTPQHAQIGFTDKVLVRQIEHVVQARQWRGA
jgi:hypothetical protein